MRIVVLLMIFAFIQVEGRNTSLREAINLLRQAVRSKQLSLRKVVSNVDVTDNSGNIITAGTVGNVGSNVGRGVPDANVDVTDNSGNIITAGTVGNVASNVGRDVSEPEFLSKRIVVLGQKYQRNGDVIANVDVNDNSGNVITAVNVGNVGNGAGNPPAKPTNDDGNGVSSNIDVGGSNSGNIVTADVAGDIGRNVNTNVNVAGARQVTVDFTDSENYSVDINCNFGLCEYCLPTNLIEGPIFDFCFLECCD